MSSQDVSMAIARIYYEVEDQLYSLSKSNVQWEVFQQLKKDASLVGLNLQLDASLTLQDWYEQLKLLLTDLLTNGDVRNFLYRIDVSEKKIRQIADLSIDDLCILVLEREFRKVCIQKHFSPR
ncbi:hypothetical protein [Parvicella tangerina]|uniref:Uncharacterized protein n=1 Tax=Parvicella tangerina TaxID=2829795 RepID=A0A916JQM2_9FLAO|nr:hypothetical protein [Parvicella tangerina]CAG5087063.1 hypothetical protein CRYO30217_03379 [Parvicella tangerina]